MKIEEAIKQLSESKKRKFEQTYDLVINLSNIDLKKPENKFSKEIRLPHGRGKDIDVCVISDNKGDLSRADIEGLKGKKTKELLNKYDFFLCEAPLMPLVGRVLGKYLGPKGKMPKLLPPGTDPAKLIEETKKSVRINVRDSPVIHVIAGSEKMAPEQVKENAEKIIDEVKKSLPGKVRIKSIYIKLTMSKPCRLDV